MKTIIKSLLLLVGCIAISGCEGTYSYYESPPPRVVYYYEPQPVYTYYYTYPSYYYTYDSCNRVWVRRCR